MDVRSDKEGSDSIRETPSKIGASVQENYRKTTEVA